MIIAAWAFGNGKMGDEYYERYTKVKEHRDKLFVDKTSITHGRRDFEGKILPGGEHLTELDIALILDGGNMCFGGNCSIFSQRFTCTVYTD